MVEPFSCYFPSFALAFVSCILVIVFVIDCYYNGSLAASVSRCFGQDYWTGICLSFFGVCLDLLLSLLSWPLTNISPGRRPFLLALPSAERVNGLHGLSFRVRHSQGWISCTFSFFLTLLLRPRIPRFDEFTVLSLDSFVDGDKGELLLSVIRALWKYFLGWSSIFLVLRVSLCLLICGRSRCLVTPFLSGCGLSSSLPFSQSLRWSVVNSRFGHMKSGKSLLPCCLRGTAWSIRYCLVDFLLLPWRCHPQALGYVLRWACGGGSAGRVTH